MVDPVEQMRALNSACQAAREYAGGDAIKHVVRMLIELEKDYTEKLVNAPTDQVARLQTCILQIRALADCLRPDSARVIPTI